MSYMLKEIKEEKEILRNESELIYNDASELNKKLISNRVIIVGSGTSYNAGLMFQYALFKRGKFSSLFFASEVSNYLDSINSLEDYNAILISHSGESIDILNAAKFLKQKGARLTAVTDFENSSLWKISNHGINMRAGAENSVAATKSHMSQLILSLSLLARDKDEFLKIINKSLNNITKIIGDPYFEELGKLLKEKIVILGKGVFYPIACEGALKLKETSEVVAEGYSSREFIHGPIQILNEDWTVILVSEHDESFKSKIIHSNASIIDLYGYVKSKYNCVEEYEILIPLLSGLQLLSYFKSLSKGKNPDIPSKLSKVVTS